jgi:hypothetical protein
MGVPVLHFGAAVVCMHAGLAQPTWQNPRVKVSGMNTVTIACQYSIIGCTLPPEAGGPCATATWLTGATRVRADGLPLLLQDSQAICAPTGTGLEVLGIQPRVTAL